MLKISEDFIYSKAQNYKAFVNAIKLVHENSFVKLNISQDETIIFGECTGGRDEDIYFTSADFIFPDDPVCQCTCPSPQTPCKHTLGLMYAYANGCKFTIEAVPEDIIKKREKVKKSVKKQEEKKEQQDKNEEHKKHDNLSPINKIKKQIEGLELLEKIICDILRRGLATIDRENLKVLHNQVKLLGNYYIPGVHSAFIEFFEQIRFAYKYDKPYFPPIDQLTVVYTLTKKGKEHLIKRLDDPEAPYDPNSTNSAIDELFGHSWELSELRQAGRVQKNVELVQLFFRDYNDSERQAVVDEGIWIQLGSGQLVLTLNCRPFNKLEYTTEEDSESSVVHTKELFIYPGDLNPRVCWETSSLRQLTEDDCSVIRAHASRSYKETIKLVKDQIKNPLSDKYPVALLHYKKICKVGVNFILEDVEGQRLILSNQNIFQGTLEELERLPKQDMEDQVMLVRFHYDPYRKRLCAKPLSIVKENEIFRLAW